MSIVLEKGTSFVMKHARLLERAVFEYQLFNLPPDRILSALRAYQNTDGGFGHALEPDLRCPDSQPLFLEFGLRTLYECDLKDDSIAQSACRFLEKHADLDLGIVTIFSSSRCFPRAAHWENPSSEQADMGRLISLVGLLNWQGVKNAWLEEAVGVCLNRISSQKLEDAHLIQNAFCLLESVAETRDVDHLFKKLQVELIKSNFYIPGTPVEGYGLTPLEFAPSPDSYCRRIFSDQQIRDHLVEIESKQQEDGGWGIEWNPPGETAYWEWRGYRTVKTLATLRAYDRI